MARQIRQQLDLGDLLDQLGDGLVESITSVFSYEPHPKQETFHRSILQEKLFIGGNRSGKTVANVIECIWRLTKTHPFRQDLNNIEGEIRGRFVCVSFVDGLEKIILPLFKKWLPQRYLVNRSWEKSYNKHTRTLTLSNGSFLEFMSYDQELEKFAGTSRHFCTFDEEPPKSVWEECLMRLIDTDGDWWISMTPVEGLTWVFFSLYKPWEDGQKDELLVVKVSMDDNPHLTEKGKERALKNITDEDDRAARKEGSFVEIKGLVYKSFDPHIHKRKDFQLRPDMRIWTSLDTGWTHPAAWLWHAVEPSGKITTFHEIVESEVTVEEFAARVKAYEKAVLEPLGLSVYVRTGDPAMLQTKEHTGTSIIQEYAKHDIFIGVEGVPRGPGSVDIGVIKMTQYLNNRAYDGTPIWGYTPECETLEIQMRTMRWEKYATKKMNQEKAPKVTIDKKNDDAPDSLRYFITLQDDLTPEKLADIQKNPDLIISVPYYSGVSQGMPSNADYQIYEGSILHGIEG